MTEHPEPDIRLDVNLRNPGQFFACCGALELASRLWPGTPENGWTSPEGWFAGSGPQKTFEIATHSGTEQPLTVILARLADEEPIVELAEDHEAYAGGDRKPVVLRAPFRLRLDWWLDSYRGADKSELKVWAGQMTPRGMLSALQTQLRQLDGEGWKGVGLRQLLSAKVPASATGLDPSSSWVAIDVGFSPDEQNVSVLAAPATELLAMIGLQRCRPIMNEAQRRRWFIYRAWADPLEIAVVPAATAGAGRTLACYTFPVEMRNAQYGQFGWAKPWEDRR